MAEKAAKLCPPGPARQEAEELKLKACGAEGGTGAGAPSPPSGPGGGGADPAHTSNSGAGPGPRSSSGSPTPPSLERKGPGGIAGSALGVLPALAGALGWERGETWLRSKMTAPGGSQRPAAVVGTYLLFFAAAGLALLLGSFLVTLLLRLGWRSVRYGSSLVLTAVVAAFWRPVWFVALPVAVAVAVQPWSPLLSVMWGYPVFWWLTGGGWWGSIVGTVATFLMAVLVGGGLLPALLVWTLISYVWHLVGAWWLRYPLCIALLAGWFFAVAILGFDFSQTASEATLNTDVPAGATGEVARVLSCRDYYAVLELPRDADADAVKKSHRKKVLKTHPDKLGTDVVGGSEAFGRVQKAFEILSDMKKKRTYDILLHDADKKSQESAEATAGKSGPAEKEKKA